MMSRLQNFVEQLLPLFVKKETTSSFVGNVDVFYEKKDNKNTYFISCINDLNNPKPSNHELAVVSISDDILYMFNVLKKKDFTVDWENRVFGRAYMPTMELALQMINIFDNISFDQSEKEVIFHKLFNNIDFVNIYSLHEKPSENFTNLMLKNWTITENNDVVKLFENINNHHYNDISISCLDFLYNNKDIINAYDNSIKIELYKHIKKNVSSNYYQSMEEFLHIDLHPLPLVQPNEAQLKLYTINHRNSFFNKNFEMILDLCKILNQQHIEGFQHINVFKRNATSTTLAIEYSSEKTCENIMQIWQDLLPTYDELIMKQPDMKNDETYMSKVIASLLLQHDLPPPKKTTSRGIKI